MVITCFRRQEGSYILMIVIIKASDTSCGYRIPTQSSGHLCKLENVSLDENMCQSLTKT